jgi:hypothetical protein
MTRPLPLALKNAHELGPQRSRLWLGARLLVPQPYRSLYEGHLHIPGQMWFEERRVLYETIRRLRPQQCFEVGTWMGGGSTFVIAQALRRNGGGRLHTIEVLDDVHRQAVERYERHVPELRPFVEFHLGDYRDVFPELIRSGGVDFFVLDGAEDAEQTLEQFRFFDERSHVGTALFAHDWESEKTRLVRPELERSERWRIDQVVGPPKSVGLAIATRSA